MNNRFFLQSSAHLPPLRLINPIVILARIATRYDIPPPTLLEGSGLTPNDLADPQKLINNAQSQQVSRNFIRLVPIPWIGLEVGGEYHFSANGKLGMAMMCCETLKEAVELALTHIELTGSYHQYSLAIEGDTGTARMKEIIDLGDLRPFVCEAEIASLHSMARIGYGEETIFREIRLAYPAPSYAPRYEAMFKCPVSFNAATHSIVFDAGKLDAPLKFANPLVKTTLKKECGQLVARLLDQATVAARITQELSYLEDAYPTLEQMADQLNMSPRTMRRKLMEEHTSYKHILNDIRKIRAMTLLQTTDLPMEKVALHLGFSEVSSFYRAFKSWTGQTPNTFRKNT